MTDKIDHLVPDRTVRAELGGISAMTLWRWDKAGSFPPAIKIRNRKYRSRLALDAFKQRLIARALGK